MNNENKKYPQTKVYFDGSHYIGIPKDNFPHGKSCKRKKTKSCNANKTLAKKNLNLHTKIVKAYQRKNRKSILLNK